MDIKLTDSLLRQYLKTSATPEVIAEKLSLCGPTVDLLEKIDHDYIYHLEVITNRVDAASAFGIAREANAILPQFDLDSQLINNPYQLGLSDLGELPPNLPIKLTIADSTLVPRFTCIALDQVEVKASSTKVATQLEHHGERSLNNVIDISNELTLKYGQPVHIFDLDRIKKQTLIVRESQKNETITTLDGRTHTLKGKDIIIEDGAGRLIDLCGIMGGNLSSITPETKRVLLFVQTYEPKHIRKTSLYTQERTLASQLFEKQPDPDLVLPVLIEGVKLLQQRTGAKICSSLIDLYPSKPAQNAIPLDLTWLSKFIGITIPVSQISDILTRLGFQLTKTSSTELLCQVPSWRTHDITIKEDVAEEIARVYGYFRLPSILPITGIPAINTNPTLNLESKTREFMARLGFTEVYNSSLVSKDQNSTFKLKNPLSEDYLYMRTSLIPSLKANVLNNRSQSIPQLIFELSNVYLKQEGPLANEQSSLGLAAVGISFRELVGYLDAISNFLHIKLSFDQLVFESGDNSWFIELNLAQLFKSASLIHHFESIPQFTPIIEDLTFTLPYKTPVGPIIMDLASINPLVKQVDLKDIYQQNYTFTITYQDNDKTLSTSEIAPIRKQIVNKLAKQEISLVGKLQD